MGPGRRSTRHSAAAVRSSASAAVMPDGDKHDDRQRRYSVPRLGRWQRDGDQHDDQRRRHAVCRLFSTDGCATSTTVLSGGVQNVGGNFGGLGENTGTATSTMLSGGTQYVSAGGTATDTTIYGGGLEEVLSGGVTNAPVIDGGTLRLDSGASIATGPIDFAAVSGKSGGTLDLTGEGSGSAFTSSFTTAISGFTGEEACRHGGAKRHHRRHRLGQRRRPCRLDPERQLRNAAGRGCEQERAREPDARRQLWPATLRADRNRKRRCDHLQRVGALLLPRHPDRNRARTTRRSKQLKIGDKVRTASGALRPIKWIGRRSYGGRFVMGRKDILPICFKARFARRQRAGARPVDLAAACDVFR